MIVISSLISDLNGVVELDVDYGASDLDNSSRRVSKTKTLDAGVAIIDSGYSHGDRELKIIAKNINQVKAEALKSLHQNETIVGLSMFDGFYLAAIKSLSIRGGGARLSVFIKSKNSD